MLNLRYVYILCEICKNLRPSVPGVLKEMWPKTEQNHTIVSQALHRSPDNNLENISAAREALKCPITDVQVLIF